MRGIDIRETPKGKPGRQCGASFNVWFCTREEGHQGFHAAHIVVLQAWSPSKGAYNCNTDALAAVWEN